VSELNQIFIDSTVVFTDASIPEQAVRSFVLSNVFAQASARVKSKNVASPEYFTEFTAQLRRLGWPQTDVGQAKISQTLSHSSIADVLISIIQPAMAGSDIIKIFAAWQSTTDADSLEFWWDHVKDDDQRLNLGFGSLSTEAAVPISRIVLFSIDNTAPRSRNTPSKVDNWRSLFDQQPSHSISISIRNVTLKGDAEVFDPLIAQLETRLGPRLANHVRTERISFV